MSIVTVANLADLKRNSNTAIPLVFVYDIGDGRAGLYKWSSTSTTTAADPFIVAVTDVTTGRYLLISMFNTQTTSTHSATGNAATNPIIIPHGLNYTPKIAAILPNNSASSGVSYVTADGTNFSVFYGSAPNGSLSFNITHYK